MTEVAFPRGDEARAWDELAVTRRGGHVYQSVAWAEHRASTGWTPVFVATADLRILCLTRPWRLVPGGSAYVPRGPTPATDGARAAEALEASVALLDARRIDVVAVDAEVRAEDATYRAALRQHGFRPIEEIQPSRHRIGLPLDPPAGEDAALGGVEKSTRQRIRQAERSDLRVVRHDAAAAGGVGEGFDPPAYDTAVALDRFYSLLRDTGERRHFAFGSRDEFVGWWRRAFTAGHLVLLEAALEDRPIAGLILYRHGDRLSTVHSADLADTRREHPGALHLLRWRAIQLAIREDRAEMDLGGADIRGARHEPHEGDEMWGLYQHKVAFGGRWIELAGAHERVVRPWRYMLGRVASKVRRR